MHHRTNTSGEQNAQEESDGVWSHQSIGNNRSSDRAIVLKFIDELAVAGQGILEEVPGLDLQFLSLRSGEVFWLRENKITRIK